MVGRGVGEGALGGIVVDLLASWRCETSRHAFVKMGSQTPLLPPPPPKSGAPERTKEAKRCHRSIVSLLLLS